MKTPRSSGLTNPVTEPLIIAPVDPDDIPLTIQVPAGAQNGSGTSIMEVLRDPNETDFFGNPQVFMIDNNGSVIAYGSAGGLLPAWVLQDGDINESIQMAPGGIGVSADLDNTNEPEAIWVNINATGPAGLPDPTVSLWKLGMVGFSGVEPNDVDIQPGKVFMYFDSTNGDAQVLFKAKTLDATVVSGFLPLGVGGGDAIRVAHEDFSSADVLALSNETIHEVIPAPGAGKMVVPITAYIVYKPGTTPYNHSGYGMGLLTQEQLDNYGSIPMWSLAASIGMTGLAPSVGNFYPSFYESDTPLAWVDDQAWGLAIIPPSAPENVFADGDGTLHLTAFYSIIDLPA